MKMKERLDSGESVVFLYFLEEVIEGMLENAVMKSKSGLRALVGYLVCSMVLELFGWGNMITHVPSLKGKFLKSPMLTLPESTTILDSSITLMAADFSAPLTLERPRVVRHDGV